MLCLRGGKLSSVAWCRALAGHGQLSDPLIDTTIILRSYCCWLLEIGTLRGALLSKYAILLPAILNFRLALNIYLQPHLQSWVQILLHLMWSTAWQQASPLQSRRCMAFTAGHCARPTAMKIALCGSRHQRHDNPNIQWPTPCGTESKHPAAKDSGRPPCCKLKMLGLQCTLLSPLIE